MKKNAIKKACDEKGLNYDKISGIINRTYPYIKTNIKLSDNELVEMAVAYETYRVEFDHIFYFDSNKYNCIKSRNKNYITLSNNEIITSRILWFEILFIHFKQGTPYENCMQIALENFNIHNSLYYNRFKDNDINEINKNYS